MTNNPIAPDQMNSNNDPKAAITNKDTKAADAKLKNTNRLTTGVENHLNSRADMETGTGVVPVQINPSIILPAAKPKRERNITFEDVKSKGYSPPLPTRSITLKQEHAKAKVIARKRAAAGSPASNPTTSQCVVNLDATAITVSIPPDSPTNRTAQPLSSPQDADAPLLKNK